MKRNMKRFTAIIITLILVLGLSSVSDSALFGLNNILLSASALGSYGKCGTNVSYTFDSSTGTLTLSGTGATNTYEWGSSPFFNNKSIKIIVVEEGITKLGIYLFNGCGAVKEVYLPVSLKQISYDAFFLGKTVSTVYYAGTASQWSSISIAAGNTHLTSAARKNNYMKIKNLTVSLKENEFGVFVFDEAGEPVPQAEISFNGETLAADQDGAAVFEKPDYEIVGNNPITITAKKDGYIDFEDTVTLNSLKVNYYVIKLYLDTPENALKLSYAKYIGATTVDILNCEKSISLREFQNFGIECKANRPEEVKEYKLFQNSAEIAQSNDGVFTALDNIRFERSNNVQLITYGNDGSSVTTDLSLKFEYGDSEFSLKIGDKITVNVGNEVPFFGGSELNFDIPDLPVEIYYESDIGETNETKVHVGINTTMLNLTGSMNPDQSVVYKNKQKEKIKNIKDSINTLKKTGKALSSSSKKKLDSIIADNSQSNIPGIDSMSIKFVGYGEGVCDNTGMKSIAVDLFILADITCYEYTKTVIVGKVPVVISFSVSAGLDFSAGLKYNFRTCDLSGEFGFDVEPEIELFGGVGIGKVTGVGCYGSGKIGFDVTVISSEKPTGLNKIDLTGELGIKAYIGQFEYRKEFLYQTWVLFSTDNEDNPVFRTAAGDSDEGTVYDPGGYQICGRDYLVNKSGWLSSVSKAGIQPDSLILNPLITDAYHNSQPLIAADENDMVMVFTDSDPDRDNYNHTVLKYAVYDEESGIWSEPEQLDGNNTADTSPYLYSDGKNIYLVYCDASKVFDADLTIEEMITNQNICYSKFDSSTGKFSTPKIAAAADGKYNSAPQISVIDGQPVIFFRSNGDANVFGTNNKNSIISVNPDGSKTVLKSGLNSVIDTALCESCTAYIVDGDNVLSTVGDRVLYINNQKVDSGNISSLKEKGGKIYWYSNGTVKIWNGASVISISEEGNSGLSDKFAVTDNGIYFISSSENRTSDIYKILNINGKWSKPVRITCQDKVIDSFSVAEFDGIEYSVLARSSFSVTENDVLTSTEMDWIILKDKADISAEYVTYNQDDIIAGEAAEFTVGVKNNGTVKADKLNIKVTDSANNTLYNSVISETVLPGEEKEIFIDVPLPETIIFGEYTVTVSDNDEKHGDVDLSSNSYSLNVGYTEIDVEADLIRTGEKTYALVSTKNISSVKSAGTLKVYNSTNSATPVVSLDIGELAPGECCLNRIEITQELLGSSCGVLSFACDTSVESFDDYSGKDSLFIELCKHSTLNDWEITTPASCTEKGERVQKCKACGLTVNYASIPPCHNMGEWKNGVRKCAECGYEEHCAHSFGEWQVIKEAVGTETGIMQCECTICGMVKEEVVFGDVPNISAEKVTAVSGRQVKVELKMNNNPGISYLRLTVKCPNGISLINAENGDIISDFDTGLNLMWSSDKNSIKNGVLASLTFEIQDGIPEGEYDIQVILRECYDSDGKDIDLAIPNIVVSVTDIVFGDANGDCEVNGKDILLLRKYLANYNDDTGTSTAAINPGADANNDGVINGKDLLLLRLYMAYYDDKTGESTVILG